MYPRRGLRALTSFPARICVGMSFANQALFISVATMLWALDIRNERDEAGEEVVPDPDAFVDEGIAVYVCLSGEPTRSCIAADYDAFCLFLRPAELPPHSSV